MTWPLNGSETGGDLVLIQTSVTGFCSVNQVVLVDNCTEDCIKARSPPASLYSNGIFQLSGSIPKVTWIQRKHHVRDMELSPESLVAMLKTWPTELKVKLRIGRNKIEKKAKLIKITVVISFL